jgi:hypothetical protein
MPPALAFSQVITSGRGGVGAASSRRASPPGLVRPGGRGRHHGSLGRARWAEGLRREERHPRLGFVVEAGTSPKCHLSDVGWLATVTALPGPCPVPSSG